MIYSIAETARGSSVICTLPHIILRGMPAGSAITGYLFSFLMMSLAACAPSLSSVVIVPPPDTASDRVARDYLECRQKAQESSMTYVPAGAMLAAVSNVRTNDSRFLDCLEMKGYSITSPQRRMGSTASASSHPSYGLAGSTLQKTTYEVVLEGKSCRAVSTQSIECRYTAGKDLQFTIARVRETEASLSLLHSDRQGDFYADVGVYAGCIRVTRGAASDANAFTIVQEGATDVAFVSIRTGTVYRNAEDCQQSS